MTILTLITAALVVYAALVKKGQARALALSAATPAGAAAVVGNVAVPTFYAVTFGIAATAVIAKVVGASPQRSTTAPPLRTQRLLWILLALTVVTTLVSPILFDGLAVLTPGSASGGHLTAGEISKSNIAQILYLSLGVALVAIMTRSDWATSAILAGAVFTTIILSAWAALGQQGVLPYPTDFFDNSPFLVRQESLPGGGLRVRGIFSEPAALATSCLVAIAMSASSFVRARWPMKSFYAVIAAIAIVLGIVSTSTTFVFAGTALAAVAGLCAILRLITRRQRGLPFRIAFMAVLAAIFAAAAPRLSDYLTELFSEKQSSGSYADRTTLDSDSFDIAADTFGIGSGLGSSRGSSVVPTLLSTIGILGTIVYLSAILVLVWQVRTISQVRPVAWSIVAYLICKVVSGPDMADSTGILWISLGIMAHQLHRARTVSPHHTVELDNDKMIRSATQNNQRANRHANST